MKKTYIYLLSKNGKVFYIGKTTSIKRRASDHAKKYGVFNQRVICTCLEKDSLAIEAFLIGRYASMGYQLENRVHNREQNNVIPIKEYAEICGVNESYIRIKIKQGKITTVEGKEKAYIDTLLNPIKRPLKKAKQIPIKPMPKEKGPAPEKYVPGKGKSISESLSLPPRT